MYVMIFFYCQPCPIFHQMLNVNKREDWGGEISNFTIIEKKCSYLQLYVHLNNFWFLKMFTKPLKDWHAQIEHGEQGVYSRLPMPSLFFIFPLVCLCSVVHRTLKKEPTKSYQYKTVLFHRTRTQRWLGMRFSSPTFLCYRSTQLEAVPGD